MLSLLIGILILVVTPTIYDAVSPRPNLKRFVDAFVGLSMTYLLCGHVLPEIHGSIGNPATILFVIGFLGMTALERFGFGSHRNVHKGALLFVFLGFSLHIALDGVALSGAHDHSANNLTSLGLAVLLHRLPVAMLVWAKLYPLIGKARAFSILILMGVISALGYYLGNRLLQLPNLHTGIFYIEAFVAGCLLHVVFHQLTWIKNLITNKPKKWVNS